MRPLLFLYGIGPTTLGAIGLAAVLLLRGRGEGAAGALRPAGVGLFALGVALRMWGTAEVIEKGEGTPIYSPVCPMEPKRLVTTGPFRYSRNPLYIAKLAIMGGLALISGRPMLLALAAAWGAVLHFLVVPAEEAKLRRLFGEAYLRYLAEVPRWFGLPGAERCHGEAGPRSAMR